MFVDMKVYDQWKRAYTLTLSKEDFDHFCAGCPELDCVQGSHRGVCFQLFNGIRVPDAFQPLPDGEGYFVEIGVPVPVPRRGISSQKFDRLANIARENLRNTLTRSRFSLLDKMDKHLGYVVIKIE
ncbi:MAG: hypothetical protein Q8R18_01440 [bacterium]|nr:hypothetical protein [bacterium]